MPQLNSAVIDKSFMQRALHLAAVGAFTTTPNPNVGCVIVDPSGRVVGEGFHQQAGTPHAEVHALKQASEAARGATAYVTLEPCSHTGRTGPCADALVNAGVARVVVAMQDPNPLVSGRGIQRLVEHGIQVDIGVLESQAQHLNSGFIHRMTQGRPKVTVKLAMSLDGRTALANGDSKWITGEQARHDVHIERAKACAILTGSSTVVRDDPQMNVRLNVADIYPPELQHLGLRQPRFVAIDSGHRIRSDAAIFSAQQPPIIASCEPNRQMPADKAEQWILPRTTGNQVDLEQLIHKLGECSFNHVWVEAGSRLCGALLEQHLVDELIVYQAPKLMGQDAMPLLQLDRYTDMQRIPHLTLKTVERLDNDVKMVFVPQYNEQ